MLAVIRLLSIQENTDMLHNQRQHKQRSAGMEAYVSLIRSQHLPQMLVEVMVREGDEDHTMRLCSTLRRALLVLW